MTLPSGEGSIRVMRLDNRAASIITIEQLDINGTWSGTFTFTSIDITDQKAAEEEGCSTAFARALVGVPLPATLDVSVDDSGRGTATLVVDASDEFEDGGTDSLSYSVTQQGGSVTFEPIDGEGMSTMSATVNRDGTMLAMKGTTGASGNGWRMTAVMSVSKPE